MGSSTCPGVLDNRDMKREFSNIPDELNVC